ncbi:MAG: sigma-54 dependent transcriptional regulator [Desulfuromonadales bacterium]|nr:sigma-54 dependent transcriptional regulator [Desulfuromonadales bacterium]
MTEPEIIIDKEIPLRAPDLVVASSLDRGWVVQQLSARFSEMVGLGDLEVVGHALHEVFADVSPGLDYLADEVSMLGDQLRQIAIDFQGGRDCRLIVDVMPGGVNDRGRQQAFFYFRLASVGLARKDEPSSRFGLVGSSPGMQEVFRKIELYAPADASVVVTGETGSGKELVARALHDHSPRRDHAFVAVNCSAISAELLESELFGHEKGAFTSAVRTHKGRFERADRGTIFLDEVGDMPEPAQVKLLRILEEGVLERVGSEKAVKVDVRVVAATNVPMERAVQQGRFRADLYHRLAVLRIHLPALRQRVDDIPLLVEYFLGFFRRKYGRKVDRLTNEAVSLLQSYLWPGNVRELRNVLERVFIEIQSEVIGARAFREWVHERQDFSPGDWGPGNMGGDGSALALPYPMGDQRVLLSRPERLALGAPENPEASLRFRTTYPVDLDVDDIRQAWKAANGNLAAAARLLGVHRATLYRYMKKLGLSRNTLDS